MFPAAGKSCFCNGSRFSNPDGQNNIQLLANMFELVLVINSIKDKQIRPEALSAETLYLLQVKMKTFVKDIFGLRSEIAG